tara:strand:+ start:65278 stop:65556 length:279 start_codon:yes stop_codon:yes gene_type:complete
MKTINKIITNVNSRYGAPMGRSNVIPKPLRGNFEYYVGRTRFVPGFMPRIYDCRVPMSSCGAYDKGGAYWGIGKELRVSYTKDLTLIYFYRI